jgi:hypothetical protein
MVSSVNSQGNYQCYDSNRDNSIPDRILKQIEQTIRELQSMGDQIADFPTQKKVYQLLSEIDKLFEEIFEKKCTLSCERDKKLFEYAIEYANSNIFDLFLQAGFKLTDEVLTAISQKRYGLFRHLFPQIVQMPLSDSIKNTLLDAIFNMDTIPWQERTQMIVSMIEYGASIQNRKIVVNAIFYNDLELLKFFLAQGGDIAALDNGNAPFMRYCLHRLAVAPDEIALQILDLVLSKHSLIFPDVLRGLPKKNLAKIKLEPEDLILIFSTSGMQNALESVDERKMLDVLTPDQQTALFYLAIKHLQYDTIHYLIKKGWHVDESLTEFALNSSHFGIIQAMNFKERLEKWLMTKPAPLSEEIEGLLYHAPNLKEILLFLEDLSEKNKEYAPIIQSTIKKFSKAAALCGRFISHKDKCEILDVYKKIKNPSEEAIKGFAHAQLLYGTDWKMTIKRCRLLPADQFDNLMAFLSALSHDRLIAGGKTLADISAFQTIRSLHSEDTLSYTLIQSLKRPLH